MAQRRGRLHADEAAADDDGTLGSAPPRGSLSSRRSCVARRRLRGRFLDSKAARRRPRRHEQLVVGKADGVVEPEPAHAGLNGDRLGLEQDFDVVLAVERLILDMWRLVRVAAQVALDSAGRW